MQKETVPRNSWPIPTISWIPYPNDWKSSRWRSWTTMRCSRGWRSHSPFDRTRILLRQEQNGGFIPTSKVPIPCHWEIVLISSKRCLPCNDYNKKQEKNHTCLLTLTSTNHGSWHRVHLLHDGIGKVPDGFLTIQKVKKEVSQVLSERLDPLLPVFWHKPSKMAFTNSVYFVTDGSFTADGGLL